MERGKDGGTEGHGEGERKKGERGKMFPVSRGEKERGYERESTITKIMNKRKDFSTYLKATR